MIHIFVFLFINYGRLSIISFNFSIIGQIFNYCSYWFIYYNFYLWDLFFYFISVILSRNWFCTLWSGCFFLISQFFFIIGFLLSFSFGGFTGLILANCMIDTLLHDSYFVVGHFHYVLSLGAVYTFFGAFYNYFIFFSCYFWFNEFLGRIHFSFFFISSNIIFFSMHSLGLIGFPRRIFDYPIIYVRYHWINSLGLIGIILSILLFLLSIAVFILVQKLFIIVFILVYFY